MDIDGASSSQLSVPFSQNSLSEGLSSEQEKINEMGNGPIMVSAAPGSGKTRTLIERIKNLLGKGYRVLTLTFSKEACLEIRKRVQMRSLCMNVNDNKAYYDNVYTFHGLGLRILLNTDNQLGGLKGASFTLFTASQQRNLIKKILKNLKYCGKGKLVEIDKKAKHYESLINKAKGILKKPDDFNGFFSILFSEYNSQLANADGLDFMDIIQRTVRLLKTDKTTLEYYQNKYDAICVDEIQDNTPDQLQLMFLLANKHENITVFGDPDQSIYGFRQGVFLNDVDDNDIQINKEFSNDDDNRNNNNNDDDEVKGGYADFVNNNINHQNAFADNDNEFFEVRKTPFEIFNSRYPNRVKVLELNNCFRSSKTIVKALNLLMGRNFETRNCEGSCINMIMSKDCLEEASNIFTKIKECVYNHQNVNPINIAVLGRTHKALKFLKTFLCAKGLSVVYNGSKIERNNFLKMSVCEKDMIGTLLNYCNKICGGSFTECNVRKKSNLSFNEKFWEDLRSRCSDDMFINEIIDIIIDSTDLKKFRLEPSKHKNVNRKRKIEFMKSSKMLFDKDFDNDNDNKNNCNDEYNVDMFSVNHIHCVRRLIHFVKYSRTFDDTYCTTHKRVSNFERLKSFVKYVKVNVFDSRFDEKSDIVVTLSTIHSAKGLEWDAVFVVQFNENELPSQFTLDEVDVLGEGDPLSEKKHYEEERRVAYVALSRAKTLLFLSFIQINDKGDQVMPSRYIKEICNENDILLIK